MNDFTGRQSEEAKVTVVEAAFGVQPWAAVGMNWKWAIETWLGLSNKASHESSRQAWQCNSMNNFLCSWNDRDGFILAMFLNRKKEHLSICFQTLNI